jgi:pimeloyl-ACP methyl ester carboxylesterase
MSTRWPVLLSLLLALATLGPTATSASAAEPRTTVLLAGGYGSTLTSARQSFAPLRAALEARHPGLSFAQYSYTGWNAQTCTPLDYAPEDSAQDLATSERHMLETLYLLHTQCGADHLVVIGHSLGGLVAFHALSDNPMAEVSDVITIDSPLGGAPAAEIRACVDSGMCAEGPVSQVLADLHASWAQTAADNTARVVRLSAAGTRVTAWGNQSDCLYAPAVCVPLARVLIGPYDVRDTQWLGIDRAMIRNYSPGKSLTAVLNSHQAVLSTAAPDIAADLFA